MGRAVALKRFEGTGLEVAAVHAEHLPEQLAAIPPFLPRDPVEVLGADRKTIDLHLGILENLLLVRAFPAWHSKLSKREIKTPKIYVADTGMMMALVGADQRRLASDAGLAGGEFETFAAMELERPASWSDDPPRMFHYRDRDGREVDIVLERAVAETPSCRAAEMGSPHGQQLTCASSVPTRASRAWRAFPRKPPCSLASR
ncbi:MAG: DUF4143 domain-containing protein [Actinobacteria bacterium]|nr:DUF4143 domain-containing protein [Actinomycetota bacterium]